MSIATPCTSCTCSCSSGLLLSLTQSNATVCVSSGTCGFTTYQFTWRAPSTTSATIKFQFLIAMSGTYWGLDSVSVKDSSSIEKITNGNFSSKSSWNESCGMSSCASIGNYGPGGTPVYVVNYITSSNYYSVSQTFTIVACETYNISFSIALYQASGSTANAFVYIY